MGDSQRLINKLNAALHNICRIQNEVDSVSAQLADKSLVNKCDLSLAENFIDRLVETSQICLTALEAIPSCFKLTVPWLPDSYKETCDLTFLEGLNPWSFWLVSDRRSELDSLQLKLCEQFRNGQLKKLNNVPKVGNFVICVDRKIIFRGLVLNTFADKIKVLNIDDSVSKVMKLENIYYFTKDFCEPCAFVVHCCLTEDKSLDKLWNSDLSDLFKSTLRECNLRVKFTNQIDGLPPIYIVDITGYYDNVEFDVNKWIFQKLFPVLKQFNSASEVDINQFPESVLYPYSTNYDSQNGNPLEGNQNRIENVTGEEKLEGLIPPLVVASPASSQAWSSSLIPNSGMYVYQFFSNLNNEKTDEVVSQYAAIFGYGDAKIVKPFFQQNAQTICPSLPVQNKSSGTEDIKPLSPSSSALNASCPAFEPSNKVECNVPEVLSYDEKCTEVMEDKGICPTFSSKGFCLEENCEKSHTRLKSDEKVNFYSADEAIDSIEDDAAMEEVFDPYLNGGYEPTDEMRICKFFASGGKCFKVHCKKEHIIPNPYKWTTDIIDGFTTAFHEICLPEAGETIDVKVRSVTNAYSFYGTLPDEYSDIGELDSNYETYDDMEKYLSQKENIAVLSSLTTDPAPAEILIGFSSDGCWRRIRVVEINEPLVTVFHVDLGIMDNIPIKNLRKICTKYLHLPFQAVQFHLNGLYLIPEMDKRGKKFLASLIEHKLVSVTVELRDSTGEPLLHVSAKCNGLDINKEMVMKGYCETYY